jgi:hypothetical protein
MVALEHLLIMSLIILATIIMLVLNVHGTKVWSLAFPVFPSAIRLFVSMQNLSIQSELKGSSSSSYKNGGIEKKRLCLLIFFLLEANHLTRWFNKLEKKVADLQGNMLLILAASF